MSVPTVSFFNLRVPSGRPFARSARPPAPFSSRPTTSLSFRSLASSPSLIKGNGEFTPVTRVPARPATQPRQNLAPPTRLTDQFTPWARKYTECKSSPTRDIDRRICTLHIPFICCESFRELDQVVTARQAGLNKTKNLRSRRHLVSSTHQGYENRYGEIRRQEREEREQWESVRVGSKGHC